MWDPWWRTSGVVALRPGPEAVVVATVAVVVTTVALPHEGVLDPVAPLQAHSTLVCRRVCCIQRRHQARVQKMDA